MDEQEAAAAKEQILTVEDGDSTGRSRRKSPIDQEIRFALDNQSDKTSVYEMLGDDEEIIVFTPKIGMFGAPQCRCTTSVIALLAIIFGMTFSTSGLCVLVFFVETEPTLLPLGLTLAGLGVVMFTIGSLMWCSEFMCNNCLKTAYTKIKEAPLKNAIERRSRMASRSTQRTGSRLSNSTKISLSSGVSIKTTSTRY
ncbi:unnamed protein product [Bursaphelenchus xylophilus]|uniref:(pine wood nematode) hypothetical protein n=1 Tax=Bursaphelenchus xylophilus TaxID=6326 RepID=A0A1I7RLE2_BURXY|nr:unnamed protein product [Bursaphelenchus xylophilus]CAG9083094.1 unnamed protein product [Bursaphelenchus xylophilus]